MIGDLRSLIPLSMYINTAVPPGRFRGKHNESKHNKHNLHNQSLLPTCLNPPSATIYHVKYTLVADSRPLTEPSRFSLLHIQIAILSIVPSSPLNRKWNLVRSFSA